jgi:hypothetical protein
MGWLKRVRKTVFSFMFIVMIYALLAPEYCKASPIFHGVGHMQAASSLMNSCCGISGPAEISRGGFIRDTWMYQRARVSMILDNPVNHGLVPMAAHPFRQSLQSLRVYSLLDYDASLGSEDSSVFFSEYNERLTNLLSPLFVGCVLIGIAGIISRYGARPAPARTRYAHDQVEAGAAHEKTLSART